MRLECQIEMHSEWQEDVRMKERIERCAERKERANGISIETPIYLNDDDF